MEKMQLVVLDFDEYREAFSLWSIIFVKINDKCFPDDQWWDSTSDLLEMWITNVCGLVCGSIDTCTLWFMDGDYSIKFTMQGAQEAQVVCLAPRGKAVLNETIDLLHFARQLLAAVGRFVAHYAEHKDSRIIQQLTREADQLRSLLQRKKQNKTRGRFETTAKTGDGTMS